MEKQTKTIKIAKLFITIILTLTLFSISYFIISIILKSRNIYYTNLRMLGAEYTSIRKILNIELLIISSIAYGIVTTIIFLIKMNILHFSYIAKLIAHLELSEYLLVLIIIVLMTKLLSTRFTKKLFKNTLIKKYNEEV